MMIGNMNSFSIKNSNSKLPLYSIFTGVLAILFFYISIFSVDIFGTYIKKVGEISMLLFIIALLFHFFFYMKSIARKSNIILIVICSIPLVVNIVIVINLFYILFILSILRI